MAESGAPGFAADIAKLFTEIDVDHMKSYGLDLSDRDDVTKHAANILAVVMDGSMPPPGTGERWSKEMCDTFRSWMEQGCQP